MTPERWKKLDLLFHEALELQGEERNAHLAKVCGDDEELRAEAERLLVAHERDGSFIDSPIFAETAGPAEDSNEFQAGRRIGPYRIVSRIGRGGMGEVFLAEDTKLERRVALKVLPAVFTKNTDRVRRFEREAKAASALNHPNILTIHEIGEDGDAHYIVSEFVEGETLRALIKRGKLAVSHATGIAIQIAGALSLAHEAGIIHRDVKPENVMVRPDGLVKILDFGLAKLTEQPASTVVADSQTTAPAPMSTESGVVMGTVSYMSPEQARGQKVDHRTDIFSLGVMLYEMIAGCRPFAGATMSDEMAALLIAEPPPLGKHGFKPPEGLEQIVSKCLVKDREARYQSAAQLHSDLRDLERDLNSMGTVPTVKSRALSRMRTARPMLIFAALAVLAVAVLIYVLSGSKPAPPQQAVAEVRSLAVLPFKSLNREMGDDYLGLGIADAIITRTSQMKKLVVRPISAVHGYHNQKVDPLEVGRELQVDAVLDGSVQRVGDHLRVSLNLLRVPDGASLWAQTLDREMKNAFALQDDISSNVVKALHVTLTAGEQQQLDIPPTKNAEAYDYYLRGSYYLANEGGKENMEKAITMFDRATTLDPSYALAHVGVASASSILFFNHSDKKYEERSYVALQKALNLDPNLARAYAIRGNLAWTLSNGFPHDRAIKDFRRALEIDPNLAIAHRILGATLIHLGLLDQAMAELQTTLRLEPNDPGAPPRIARIYWFQQKYALALAEFQKANRPGFVWEMALTLWHLGRKDEAFALVEKEFSRESRGNRYDLHAAYAVLLADAGRGREAEEQIRLAIDGGQGVSHFHHAEFSIACAYALMGRKQQAMEWLEKTAEHGMPCYPLFNTEPALNSLRSDPQFRAFMEKMKKQWETFVRDFG